MSVRDILGDELFADFITDLLAENPDINASDFSYLCRVWLKN